MPSRCYAALIALLLCSAVLTRPSQAENTAEGSGKPAAAEPAGKSAEGLAEDEFLDLVSAYQSGYLQVVAVSCYQLYAGAGLVEGAFRAGHVDGPSALEVLGQNSLLHSVCYTTLIQVQQLTPPEDRVAMTEINRLGMLLETENQLLTALADFFAQPSDATSKAVDDARTVVENTLERYAVSEESDPGAG